LKVAKAVHQVEKTLRAHARRHALSFNPQDSSDLGQFYGLTGEDLRQEACLRLCQESISPANAVKKALTGNDTIRKRIERGQESNLSSFDPPCRERDCPEWEAVDREQAARLEGGLDRLPSDQRAILEDRYFSDLTWRQIALKHDLKTKQQAQRKCKKAEKGLALTLCSN
jgi:DNA-directed RNA polymerase specialized sigma24 family protein